MRPTVPDTDAYASITRWLTKHLILSGHRKIALLAVFICIPFSHLILAAWSYKMRKLNIKMLKLESYGPQSVIIAFNDFVTLGVLLELLQLVSENVLKV